MIEDSGATRSLRALFTLVQDYFDNVNIDSVSKLIWLPRSDNASKSFIEMVCFEGIQGSFS